MTINYQRHSLLTSTDVGSIVRWTVADTAARLALTLAETDNGRVCYQTDSGLYFLADHSVPTWIQMSASAAAVTSVAGATGDVTLADMGLNLVSNVKDNLAASTDPGVGDDTDDGYSTGSIWVNTSTPAAFICITAASGAADWNQIDAAGGGGGGTVDVVSNVAQDRILGRVEAGAGDSEELTAAQVRTLINVADGATAAGATGDSHAGVTTGNPHGVTAADLGVEAGATADMTGAEIKAAYEAEADTNAFTDAAAAKLGTMHRGAFGIGTWTYSGTTPASTGEFKPDTTLASTTGTITFFHDPNEGGRVRRALEEVPVGAHLLLRSADDYGSLHTFRVDAVNSDATKVWYTATLTNTVGEDTWSNESAWGLAILAYPKAASSSNAGLLSASDFDEIAANTAKVTNATHTGEVTGATALTITSKAVTLAKMADGTPGKWLKYNASTGVIEEADAPSGGGGGGSGTKTLSTNETVAVDATEVVIGGGYIDGSTGGTYSWNATWIYNDGGGASTQDAELRLYNDAGLLISTLLLDSSAVGLDTLTYTNQALTAGATPTSDGDIILNSTDIYEVRLYITATGSLDSVTVYSCEFVEA